ncbi:MAG: pyrroline-5-carboxylate reductase [Coraliomargaritaceae bacterium]
MDIHIAFIGAGRMASAIVRGLLDNQHYTPGQIACTCGDDPTGPALAQQTGIHHLPTLESAKSAQTIVLACKPQQLTQLSPKTIQTTRNKLLVSILAGTTLERLNQTFPEAENIVRTMPNTPGQIGAGVSAYAPQHPLSDTHSKIVENILGALGHYHLVPETQLDAVTALSGSGPAYLFEFAAALQQAGANAGLPSELAHSLTLQTLLGAAKLLDQSGESPDALRDAVTSPGGTTAAALQVLQDAQFRQTIDRAIAAAKARSIELAKL